VAVFWPASGIAAGILIVLGRRAYPALVVGVVVGTVAANLMSDRSFLTSLLKGFCNSGEAILVAWALERWFGLPFKFDNLPRVVGFLAATCLATAASATAGAATMALLHTTAPYWDVWRTWFLSDGVGIAVVAPIVIGLGQVWREPPSQGEWIEGVALLSVLTLAGLYAICQPTESWLSFNPGIVVLPPLLWLAARCPPVFAIAGAFAASMMVICVTIYGVGRFGDAAVPIMERVRGAQAAVGTRTIFTLALIALFVERKKAVGELQHREAELAEAQRVARIGSWYWDVQTDVIIGSDELLRIYGFDPATPPADFRAQFDRHHVADDLERLKAAGRRAMETGIGFQLELRAFRNEIPIWVAVRGEVVRNGADQVIGLRGTAQDITDRKLVELALAERNAQLELASKTARVGSIAIDFHTGLVKLSPGCATILGLPESTVEMSTEDVNKLMHPEDLKPLKLRRDQALLEQQREVVAQFRIRRANDGEVRWIEARSHIFYDQGGKPAQLIGVRIDFTDRKLAADMLAERNLQLELAGRVGRIGSYAYDVGAEKLQLSDGYAVLFGLPEGTTEATLNEWRARVHPEDLGRVESVHDQAVADKRHEYSIEYRIVRSDGEVRWTERRCFISYDGDARAQRVVGVSIDITERKRAEEAQKLLNAELDHRVKNALATVSAVVSHAREGSRSVADFVAALEGRIGSMAATQELLSASRWQGISLTELVHCELAPYATSNNAKINGPEVVLKPEAGQAVAMVLHELATNAAKYGALSTKEGRVMIRWDRQLNGRPHSRLVFEWQEIGGPPVVAPGEPGYGTSTIRELIPYEFHGVVDLVLARDGVRCRLELPADWLSNDNEPFSESVAHPAQRTRNA
jgi:PAS domain S-box-containing protein